MLADYSNHWAVVTGASSGIGQEFARRLAARGMHLVITGRREEALRELADELQTRHGTESMISLGDLAEPGEVAKLWEEIKSREIEVELLINNAGFGDVGAFAESDRERLLKMIRLNIGALTDLTYRALPGMAKRGHGAIVNIASVAAFQPVAYMGVYSAGKAYVLHFSEALWAEAREHGVTVMALCPGTTRTNFFEEAGAGGWLKKHRSQSVEQVVKAALKGLDKGRQYVVPGWRNYLLAMAVRLASRRTVVRESMKYFRPHPQAKKSKEAK